MKKGILTKLGLLMVASFMVTGCGPKPTPSSSPEPTSSSSEEPLPPEIDGVDLTYPLEESEINELSDADFRQTTLNFTGSTIIYEYAKLYMGEYFYDFVRTHNHMTNDEFGQFMLALSLVNEMTDDFDGDYHKSYSVLYAFAYINADRLYYTLKEMMDDGVAWGYFTNLMTSRYYASDYINADYVENGRSGVHELVEEEKAVLAANPYATDAYTSVKFIMDILESESGLTFIRFIHRFFRSMIRNLTVEEIGFTLYMTAMSEYFETDLAQNTIEDVSEHLLDFVHHVGAWFTELDISAASFAKLYPVFNIIYNKIYFNDYEMQEAFFIAKDWYAEAKDALGRVLENANPEGLRVLFKFVGLLASNINQEQLDMFFVEDMDDFDGQIIVDLYNEQYGLLTSEEKTGFNEFFAAFGVDFEEFIEKLKEAILNPEDGRALTKESDESDESVFSQIFNEYVAYPFMENFDFGQPDFYCKYRETDYVLILKEDVNFNEEDFEDYLQGTDTPNIGIQRELIANRALTRGDEVGDFVFEERDEHYAFSYRELIDMEGFDTTTSGVKETSFTVKSRITTWVWDSETGTSVKVDIPIQPTLTMKYMVVPATINELHASDHEIGVYTNDEHGVGTRQIHKDSRGNPYYFEYEALYLVKDTHYAPDDVYTKVAYPEEGRKYDTAQKRFVSYEREGVYNKTEREKVYLSSIDTSKLGTHFLTTTIYYSESETWEGPYTPTGSEKACIRYIVVESLDDIPGVDITTPVK